MTALWQDPVRAMRTRDEEQVLLCGVLEEHYGQDGVNGTSYKFLIQRGDGSFILETIDGVLGNWRYGTIPFPSERAGEIGWYDLTPEGEALNPIDEDDDPD